MGDLEKEILENLEREFYEAVFKQAIQEIKMEMDMATISTASVGGSYGVVDTTISASGPKVTVDSVKSFAGNNLLTIAETFQQELIASMSEDDFKKMAKKNLSEALTQEVIKKTKFTMLKEPASHTIRTKASVYVFSEEDLRVFMEKLINYR